MYPIWSILYFKLPSHTLSNAFVNSRYHYNSAKFHFLAKYRSLGKMLMILHKATIALKLSCLKIFLVFLSHPNTFLTFHLIIWSLTPFGVVCRIVKTLHTLSSSPGLSVDALLVVIVIVGVCIQQPLPFSSTRKHFCFHLRCCTLFLLRHVMEECEAYESLDPLEISENNIFRNISAVGVFPIIHCIILLSILSSK